MTFITKRGVGAGRIDPTSASKLTGSSSASILEGRRGDKVKFERAWVIRASKGARTLADV